MQNSKIADTTAVQARGGKDIQGIPWERLSITREKYRQTRLEQYKNYENIPHSGEGSGKVKVVICCNLLCMYVFILGLELCRKCLILNYDRP